MEKAKYPIRNEFFPFNKFAPPMSRRFVQLAQMGMKTPDTRCYVHFYTYPRKVDFTALFCRMIP